MTLVQFKYMYNFKVFMIRNNFIIQCHICQQHTILRKKTSKRV